jgi:hypothetical protein
MGITVRQDNVGDPQDVEMEVKPGWVNTSSSYPTTTTRTDRGSEGDEPTVTDVTMVVNSPSKTLM